jgi:hypothetical protein
VGKVVARACQRDRLYTQDKRYLPAATLSNLRTEWGTFAAPRHLLTFAEIHLREAVGLYEGALRHRRAAALVPCSSNDQYGWLRRS